MTLEGKNHSKPLLVTVLCNQKKVHAVLMENRSALNIYPLSTATTIGFGPSDFTPSDEGIMAYDNSRQDIVGTLSTTIFMAGETFDVEFQVLDIKSSFNLLLGGPWLHTVGVVPSSLHQKLKFKKGSRVITVRGDEDLEVGAILYDPYASQLKEEHDMYHSLAQRWSYRKGGEVMPMPEIEQTLNVQFCREGEDFLYYGFPEWSTHPITGEQVPRFQIFFAMGWPGEV
ncbi:uncharacterized protein LOC143850371 [Tasmannia lanceolata]|uniref:uncharacterized protein LOC143850371 n=1 Tax=Tasmannia lanceolata TaxID=3420 RepID=UPI0040641E37